MNWLPSWQGILVSIAVICVVRAVWIWRKYDDHRFLRFIDWPKPYDNLDAKEQFWTFGTSRSEVERALSPAYARRYGWLMTVRARRFIIVVNAIAWMLVIYGGFDLRGSFGLSNGHLSWWGVLPILAWWAARASARIIADAPDELLDERLLTLRNAAYHKAYRLLSVVVSLIGVVAIALDISITESTREFGNADWTSLTVTLPFVAVWALASLPSLVLIAKQSVDN
jgi:hypothetical protein